MFFITYIIFLFSVSFAKELSISDALEKADLTEAGVPKCEGNHLQIKPVCRFSEAQGYLTLWRVKNTRSYRCLEKAEFSIYLQDQYLPEEWNSGSTEICGAYWNGSGKLKLKISDQEAHMTVGKVPSCSLDQVSNINSLCKLAPIPSALEFFNAQLDHQTMCINILFKTTEADDLITTTIQRSRDGKSFTDLVKISSSGDKKGLYSHFDCSEKQAGSYSYRVKRRNHQGAEKIYNTVTIQSKEKILAATFSKQPITDNIFIEFNTLKKTILEMALFDKSGKMMESKQTSIESHKSGFKYGIHRYPAGTYILKLLNREENQVYVGKFQKE